jgi:hypothetical protein
MGDREERLKEIREWAETCLKIVTDRPAAANREFHTKQAYQDVLWLLDYIRELGGTA